MSENSTWPLRLDNPFSGKTTHYPAMGPEAATYRCLICRQPVNARDLGQVFHHETFRHQPIRPQLACTSPRH